MSGFVVADIIEILNNCVESKNNAVILQVLDIVISDPICLQDKNVTSLVASFMKHPELTSKVVDVFTVISSDYPESLSEETTKKVLMDGIPLCFDPKTFSCRNSILGLMCNMTLSEANSELFLQVNGEAESDQAGASSAWRNAIEKYLDYNPQAEVAADESTVDWDKVDTFQHVGSVLCHVCRVKAARKMMLQQSRDYIPRLLQQLRSTNPTRRRGCVATLRTLLFDPENHWWLVVDLKITRYLLYPLVVATPFTDKEKVGMDAVLWMRADVLAAANPKSSDDEGEGPSLGQEGQLVTSIPAGEEVDEPTKEAVLTPEEVQFSVMLLECVLLLCQTRIIREQLRKQQVYFVCRNFDIEVNDDDVSNVVNEIVQMLMREESYDDLQQGDRHEGQGIVKEEAESRVEELSNESEGNELVDGCD